MLLLGTRAMPGHQEVSSHRALLASLSILVPTQLALSREGPTCPPESQSPGKSASGPRQGTSDRSQTTEDREEGEG